MAMSDDRDRLTPIPFEPNTVRLWLRPETMLQIRNDRYWYTDVHGDLWCLRTTGDPSMPFVIEIVERRALIASTPDD